MDKSFNRGMFNKFENRKVCVAGPVITVTIVILIYALRSTTSCP